LRRNATMRETFPFNHFTIAESDIVESWRDHWDDSAITAYANRTYFALPGRTQMDIMRYLIRNERSPRIAA